MSVELKDFLVLLSERIHTASDAGNIEEALRLVDVGIDALNDVKLKLHKIQQDRG